MEAKLSVEIATRPEGGQKVNDRLFLALMPEIFDLFTEWRSLWPIEAYRVGMMKLIWWGLLAGFSS